jgi:hypothetical protein
LKKGWRNLKLEAEFLFHYETRREAESIDRAISPDNIEIPHGLAIETKREKCLFRATVKCEKTLNTFISTLDDLLACISVAEKTFQVVKSK